MTALSQAQRAYGQASATTRTPRGMEYEVFARITHRMIAAARGGKRKYPALVRALHDNRRLWTLLAADAAGDDNSLPAALRSEIVSLAAFTMRHSSDVLGRKATVAPLIEVNTAIMRGLRGDAGIRPDRAAPDREGDPT